MTKSELIDRLAAQFPQLVAKDAELAVKMIVSGDPISAPEALKSGLIEEIVEGPASGAEAFARKVPQVAEHVIGRADLLC